MLQKIILLARMVKIEHSVFALPFAYLGSFLAARGWPGWRVFIFLTLAMVAIRSYSMAINRIVDLPFDRANPRTRNRPLVTGQITVTQTVYFCLICAGIFILACAGLNTLCLALAPLVLVWAGLYSLSKRYTWLCHFVLGSVLGLAPMGGWLAFKPEFSLAALLFLAAVLFWVAGFDILYSCQDVQFDRDQGLFSLPACFGVQSALYLSTFSHINTIILFLFAGLAAELGWVYYFFWALVSLVLLWEHRLLAADDLSHINLAFFTLNGVIAIVLFLGVLVDLFFC